MSLWNRASDTINPLYAFVENNYVTVDLPVDPDCTVTILSGSLPQGLGLAGISITGTPAQVVDNTNSIVVFRATGADQFADRTFRFTVTGKDSPVWITPPGVLYVDMKRAYVMDGVRVTYQFAAVDTDQRAGETLKYFLSDGQLPPGLSLSETGLLYGVTDIIVSLDDMGDTNRVELPYDYDFEPGYDSNFYDLSELDQRITRDIPLRLSNTYDFTVSVYDGRTTPVPRSFSIIVVGNDSFKADTSRMSADSAFFTADSSCDRLPYWVTPSNLGFYRGNDNITVYLDIFDPNNITGYALYELLSVNLDGTDSVLPTGIQLDHHRGLLQGLTQSSSQSKADYAFTIRARSLINDDWYTDRQFLLSIVDNSYSSFSWITDSHIGSIRPYQLSLMSIRAESSNPNTQVVYELISGLLPPGLQLARDGNIIGQVNPYSDHNQLGLTYFDQGNVTFDRNTTSIDRQFSFVVNASDNRNQSGSNQRFVISVDEPENIQYTDVIIKPYLNSQMRTSYHDLIADVSVFDTESIFRLNDPRFGICYDPEIILYSGIETVTLQEFYTVVEGFHRTRFKIQGAKLAQAYAVGTRDVIYELVYLELSDPNYSRAHTDVYHYFNIEALRERLRLLGETDIRQERLWMRSMQESTGVQELGFTLALPLAYCKPGHGRTVLRALELSNHDIYQYDMDTDRIVIHRFPDSENTQYVWFPHVEPQRYV